MDLFTIGFPTALSISNLYYCFIGVFVGTFVGVLPGLGSIAAISLLFPFTLYLDPVSAVIMLGGIYYGGSYGGSTASILVNVAGDPSSAVVCLDGHQMTRQGRAGVALFTAAVASFCGGVIGILVMMLLTPTIAAMAMSFGPAEYFAAMLLGLVAASSVGNDVPLNGIGMLLLGLLFGFVGYDLSTGVARYTFGFFQLYDGINIVPFVMGLFGVASVVLAMNRPQGVMVTEKVTLRSMIPTRTDLREATGATLRGSFIGSALGSLPGTGPTLASFVSYGMEKRLSRRPERLGRGAIEGVASPEAANNAATQTAFVPTMSLGVPGSATMAIILGALLIHGITPGPLLIVERPDVFWGLVASFWIGNIMLLILNLPLIGMWIRLLKTPARYLYPAIVVFVCIGTYAVRMSIFDVWMAGIFGAVGWGIVRLGFPPAPLLIGFILGPLLEQNFRNAISLARGNILGLAHSPIAATFLIASAALLAWVAWSSFSVRFRARRAADQTP